MLGYSIKQSSAVQPLMFLMVQSLDHISPALGLTPTVAISKNGLGFMSPIGAVSELGNGWYRVAANANDTNVLGPLLLHATATGADPVDVVYAIVAFDPQSSSNLGLSALPTSAPGAANGLPLYVAYPANWSALSISSAGKVAATIAAGDMPGTAQTGDAYALLTGLVVTTDHTQFTAHAVALAPTGTGGGGTPQTGDAYALLVGLVASGDRTQFTAHALALAPVYSGGGTPQTGDAYALLAGLVVTGDHTQLTAHALALAPTSSGGGGAIDPWTLILPGAYPPGSAGYIMGTRLDQAVSAPVTVSEVLDKTGYALDAQGLDEIPMEVPRVPPTSWASMLPYVYSRHFCAVNKDPDAGTFTTRDLNNAIIAVQQYTDDGAGAETMGKAQ